MDADVLISCRCCLHAAPELDLMTPYTHLGKTEIYLEVLRNCFDLHLTRAGNDWGGICFTCVERLRDASNFKLQVQRCQAELLERLQSSHVEYEKVTIKSEIDKDGFGGETVSNEECATVKLEIITEDETAEIAGVETVEIQVKSECAGGTQAFNLEAMSSGPAPSYSETGVKTDPTLPTCDELSAGHMSDSETSESSTEEHSSEASEEHDRAQRRFQCNLCTKYFAYKSALKRHQRIIHRTEKMYICELCNRKFTTKDYLDKHKNTHVGEKSFCCDICNKIFMTENQLDTHKVKHTGEKPYKCENCSKAFTLKCYLEQHRTKCGQKYVCDLCNKEFVKKVLFNRHMLNHSGILPYECTECNKRFSRKELLTAHSKTEIHSVEKSFTCEECNKQFCHKRNLLRHKLTHSGQKYECAICNKKFNRKDALKAHQKFHAGQVRTRKEKYTCKECNKQFLSKTDLTRHARTHTGEKPFACEGCQKRFNQKAHLVTHLKSCKHVGIQ